MDLLGGLRSTMECERERELLLCFGRAEVRKKRQSTVGKEGEGYKYPKPQRSLKSWQCRGSSAVVPLCGSASLHVRHCRTRQDIKGMSEVLAILAVKLRVHV